MKRTKITYWISTSIVALMMTFSAYSYLTKPEIAAGFHHLGYPDYFGIALTVFKVLGALLLIIPQAPKRLKEWAYAGFTFDFLFASISHGAIDGMSNFQTYFPLVVLAVLMVSYFYYHKINNNTAVN